MNSACSPTSAKKYLVGAGCYQREVTVVVDHQHEHPDVPHVGQVAENNQEDRQAVVKGVLEEVALGTDEDVAEETAEVLAELGNVEHLHFKSD